MNKLKLGFLFLVPLLFSCKKVLDTSPYNSITDASAFTTAAKCALALNGVYDAAQGNFYVTGAAENRGYPFGAASIYQSDARGEDLVNIQAFLQVTYQATYNATNQNSGAMWKGIYELINKANTAIAGFRGASGGVLTTAIAAQYEAECRLLRAMAHHEALLHWARPYLENAGASLGVPWRDFPINSGAAVTTILNSPRMSVAGVYTNILADLDYAETNLVPLISSAVPTIPGSGVTGVNTFRATKAAAIALKMRMKMHKGDWAGVKAEGDKIVPAAVTPGNPPGTVSQIGGWALTALPLGPFTNNNSGESIFSIKNDPVDAPSTNGALSRLLGSASLGGRGLVSISPVIYNNPGWLCDDKRRDTTTLGASGVGMLARGTNSAGTISIFTTKFRYSGGNSIMNFTRQEVLFNQSFQNNGSEILDRWTTPGQVTNVPKLYQGQAANINQTGSALSRFVEDGSYIRLQNVVLSYAFDNAMLEKRTKGYIKSARFFVQGQNLYVWTKYKGADPDNINTFVGAQPIQGVDAAVSPQVRNMSVGVSLGF